ncbi:MULTISPECIES: ATP-binding protein [unclassified Crossiella]|uniref:AAA family ATPase n=1 Tax=unclassified Crossiella TaxID=2620835 RepID=UPI001FFF7733|nr:MULTISPECIES: ATP-binding protein [unclassified Crossiella]MCK2245246.1 AAA family ATPase [Crossiella sp. S99.2]MCK2258899.1 AAA family ATPase [Crossiella sp. S99.1]
MASDSVPSGPSPAETEVTTDAPALLAILHAVDSWSAYGPPSPPAPPVTVTGQAPQPPVSLVGRQAILEDVEHAVQQARTGRRPVVQVTGAAGIGKTAVVAQWAHQHTAVSGERVLWAGLGQPGVDPQTAAAMAVNDWLCAAGVPPAAIDSVCDEQEKMALLERTVCGPTVLVLDHSEAVHAEHLRALVPQGRSTVLVVVTRSTLDLGVEHTDPVRLEALNETDGRALLAGMLGGSRIGAASAACTRLVRQCVGNPLALTVIGAGLAAAPDRPLTAATAALDQGLRRPGTHSLLAAVVEVARGWLPPVWDRGLPALLCHGLPVSPTMAAIACGLATVEEGYDLLCGLAQRGLIEVVDPVHYRAHPALAPYLRILRAGAATLDRDTRRAILVQYAEQAMAACTVIGAGHLAAPRPPTTRFVVLPPQSTDGAYTWLHTHQAALHHAVSHALTHREHSLVARLLEALTVLCLHRGGVHQVVPLLQTAVASCGGSPVYRLRLEVLLAVAQLCGACCRGGHRHFGDPRHALESLRMPEVSSRRAPGRVAGMVQALLAGMAVRMQDPVTAAALHQLSMALAARAGHPDSQGRHGWLLGRALAHPGSPAAMQRARALCDSYARLLCKEGHWGTAARVAISTAVVLARQGQLGAAAEHLNQALLPLRANRYVRDRAVVHAALALLYLLRGHRGCGRASYAEALLALPAGDEERTQLQVLLGSVFPPDTTTGSPCADPDPAIEEGAARQ